MNNVEKISPFKNFCVTIGNLPTSYLESMSYYEMLCWFCKYLENTINPAINNNAEALEELQKYVSDYFKDLDVQEEIDNKLDEMVTDGTMAEIINQEIFTNLSNRVTGVENQLKLSNIYTINSNNINGDTSIIDEYYNGTLTWNSDSSWYKFFIYLKVRNDGSNKSLYVSFPSGFNVSESYTINNAGEIWTPQGAFYGTCNLYVGTDRFVISLPINGTFYVKLNPYMYYNGVIEQNN